MTLYRDNGKYYLRWASSTFEMTRAIAGVMGIGIDREEDVHAREECMCAAVVRHPKEEMARAEKIP